ncbi:MAG: OB-fold domain-containing protein [Brevundimonas sp.]|nr:MAG: OB-fold domain-containing protein [Brevundimonas sp.]
MGLLTAQVTYRRGFLNAFKSLLPYGCGLVQLECGVRLQAHIAQPDDANAPATGSRVVLRFRSLIAGDPPSLALKRLRHERLGQLDWSVRSQA